MTLIVGKPGRAPELAFGLVAPIGSVARLGLVIHVTAGLIDIGSINKWTLQLHAAPPVRAHPGMRMGQVTFWRIESEIQLYQGKYQHSDRPMPSQIFRDVELSA